MFNAYEAVDELIDDINEDYYESCYDAIYEELCDRVECGELTLGEAEMINEAAAEKYLYEKSKNVDEALETEEDDDDKKKKESNKNIKKKINKKKLAAGVGLAAGAGALAYGANKKYKKDAYNSWNKFIREEIPRDAYNPRKIKKYSGSDSVDDETYSNFRKSVKNQKDIYKKANKLGKKYILDYKQKEREVNRRFRKLEKSDQ